MNTPEAATDLALHLRAGSLAAPMQIIEERTIGPQLGAKTSRKVSCPPCTGLQSFPSS